MRELRSRGRGVPISESLIALLLKEVAVCPVPRMLRIEGLRERQVAC